MLVSGRSINLLSFLFLLSFFFTVLSSTFYSLSWNMCFANLFAFCFVLFMKKTEMARVLYEDRIILFLLWSLFPSSILFAFFSSSLLSSFPALFSFSLSLFPHLNSNFSHFIFRLLVFSHSGAHCEIDTRADQTTLHHDLDDYITLFTAFSSSF